MKAYSLWVLVVCLSLGACEALPSAQPNIPIIEAPTRMPVPAEIVNQSLENYRAMVYIEMNVMLLNATAIQVKLNDQGISKDTGSSLALVGLTNSIDEVVTKTVKLEGLTLDWEMVTIDRNKTKDILNRWANNQIVSDQVITETEPLLNEMAAILIDTEWHLVNEFGFGLDSLAPLRQETIDKFRKTFGPVTTPPAFCDPSYPTVCISPLPPDRNCSSIPYNNFVVLPADPHHFDADKDGIGCEK